MTPEYLLDAIGLIDDDLIQEAETAPVHRPASWRRWGSLAACAVLVVALGYGAAHLPRMGGNSSSATGNGAAAPESASSSSYAATSTDDQYTVDGIGTAGSTPATESGDRIDIGGNTYILSGPVEELPEGCRLLGTLSALYPDGPAPSTTAEEYVGCQLWAPDEECPAEVYVQLPGGGWAAAQLVKP